MLVILDGLGSSPDAGRDLALIRVARVRNNAEVRETVSTRRRVTMQMSGTMARN